MGDRQRNLIVTEMLSKSWRGAETFPKAVCILGSTEKNSFHPREKDEELHAGGLDCPRTQH